MKNFFIIAVVVAFLIHFGFLKNPFASQPEYVEGYGNQVVLYATSWCGYCQKTRELLTKHGIQYTEYDIEKSSKGKKEYDKLKGSGIPLIVIDGNVVRGYNPQAILQLAKSE